jgi:RNA polymerase sigma factor (sigma-70 family)
MDIADETKLIHRLKNGSQEGYDFLYSQYGGKIYNLAYRIFGDNEDAEDITQETFIQVYRNVEQFRGDSQFFTWIFTIARNLCHKKIMNRKKNSFASMEAIIGLAQGHQQSDAISEREKKNLILQIKDGCLTGLLRCLSFNQRMAFILFVLLNLPMKDVADILGKSEGAAKVLVSRARQNLKEFLCNNCSLYNSENTCHCEKLMSFSLEKGWIKKPEDHPFDGIVAVFPEQIHDEIEKMRNVVELYQSLLDRKSSDTLAIKIQSVIQSEDWSILNHKKV